MKLRDSTANVLMEHCWLEGGVSPSVAFIDAGERTDVFDGLAIEHCVFHQGDVGDLYAIHIAGQARGVTIRNPRLTLGAFNGNDPDLMVNHIVVEPPLITAGSPYPIIALPSEVAVIGGTLADQAGLVTPAHRSLRIADRSREKPSWSS